MSALGGKLALDTPGRRSMNRAIITLALCAFPALVACDKPEPSGVRLVKAHGPSDCHLTLNGVRIPDDVLVAKGKAHRGKKADANDKSDRCEGATIMLRQAGMNTDEMPSMNLSN
jgi:hypothetical protein